MRNTLISTLGADYITFAHAKGLSKRRIMIKYAARNAILPPNDFPNDNFSVRWEGKIKIDPSSIIASC